MKKRLIAALLALALMIGCIGTVSARGPITQENVEKQLQELMAEYCGTYWWDSFHGAIQCKGFADMISSILYGDLGPGPYSGSRSYLPNAEDLGYTCRGILSYGYSPETLRALLSQALPGDYVQCVRYTGTQHSMIVVEVRTDGVTFFDCNLKGSCLCASYTYTWEECGKYLTGGISLYHKNGYIPSAAPSLIFDANGGVCTMERKSVPAGAPFGALPRPDRRGYRFDYWYVLEFNASGTPNEVRVSSDTVKTSTSDTVVYAHWSEDTGPCGLLGHTWSPVHTYYATCTTDGYVLERCAVCGATRDTNILPASGHSYRLRSGVPATNVDDGVEIYVCVRCGEEDRRPIVCMLNRFADISQADWFYPYVRTMVSYGLMNGTSETSFGPDATLTRAMLVTILWRMQGEPGAAASDFSDVARSAWYAGAVDWAFESGVVNGVSADRFAPNAPITREQAAVILYRYAPQLGYAPENMADLSVFYDAESVSGYAREAMGWANACGVISGYTDHTLRPGGSANRAQIAKMIVSFLETSAPDVQ